MSFSKCLVVAALMGAAIAAVPSASAQVPTPAVSNSTLESRIEAAIEKDTTLNQFDIDADVKNGVATLTGKVRTDAQKALAATAAKIDGITRVENNIVVAADAPMGSKADRAAAKAKAGTSKAIDATKEAAEKTVDKTKEVAGKTADKTKEVAGKTADKTKEVAGETKEKAKDVTGKTADKGKDVGKTTAEKSKDVGEKAKDAASTTGEVITDAWITTKVKAKFIDETLLKGSDINVDTNDHVVTLKGSVASAAGKARAEEIARTTDGVKRVVNQLVVKP